MWHTGILRSSKKLSYKDAAQYIHSRYPVRTVSTIVGYIHSFDVGAGHLDSAIKNKQPAKNLFILYVDALGLTKGEIEFLEKKTRDLNPNFDWKFDDNWVPKPSEHTYIYKLNALPAAQREQVEKMIDELYEAHVLRKSEQK